MSKPPTDLATLIEQAERMAVTGDPRHAAILKSLKRLTHRGRMFGPRFGDANNKPSLGKK